MEREIKFRAWDKFKNEMNYKVLAGNTDINDENYTCNCILSKTTERWLNADNVCIDLMQYTGLKDKNGKEIYEGDIVKYKFCGIYITAKIVFNQNVCSFQLSYKNINNHWITNTIYTSDDIEVIGNIYENPELLK